MRSAKPGNHLNMLLFQSQNYFQQIYQKNKQGLDVTNWLQCTHSYSDYLQLYAHV